jgi:hypothetical protein
MSIERYETEYLADHARVMTRADLRIAFVLTLLGITLVNMIA